MANNPVSIDDESVNVLFFGHITIYIHLGYQLLDSAEKILLDSDGKNLLCY